MLKVLVLNTTYEPLNVCSVRRALVLMLKDKAEVVEHSGQTVRSERAAFACPPRHPAAQLRRGAARRPQTHLAAGRLCPRRVPLPVLRRPEAPHRRPRRAALKGRRRRLGQRRHLVRALQPAQGRPAAAGRRPAPGPQAAAARTLQLRVHGGRPHPRLVAALPVVGYRDGLAVRRQKERRAAPCDPHEPPAASARCVLSRLGRAAQTVSSTRLPRPLSWPPERPPRSRRRWPPPPDEDALGARALGGGRPPDGRSCSSP